MPLVVAINAPIAGLVLDRWGRQLYVLLAANIITIVAYVLLLHVRRVFVCREKGGTSTRLVLVFLQGL